jgi:hypothetical protein
VFARLYVDHCFTLKSVSNNRKERNAQNASVEKKNVRESDAKLKNKRKEHKAHNSNKKKIRVVRAFCLLSKEEREGNSILVFMPLYRFSRRWISRRRFSRRWCPV